MNDRRLTGFVAGPVLFQRKCQTPDLGDQPAGSVAIGLGRRSVESPGGLRQELPDDQVGLGDLTHDHFLDRVLDAASALSEVIHVRADGGRADLLFKVNRVGNEARKDRLSHRRDTAIPERIILLAGVTRRSTCCGLVGGV